MEYLNEQGRYCALYFNVEGAQATREDVQRGMQAILEEMAQRARTSLDDTMEAINRQIRGLNHEWLTFPWYGPVSRR